MSEINATAKQKDRKETLKSRERVIRSISHKPVDRVPIDFGMHFSSGISAFAYWNLREYLGLSTNNIEVPDMVQLLARVDEDILKRFHSDCMLLWPDWKERSSWNPRGKYNFMIPANAKPVLNPDGSWEIIYKDTLIRMPDRGFFFDGGWPDFHEDAYEHRLDRLAIQAEKIYKETDYFTSFLTFGAFFSCDIEYMCNMLTEPDLIKETNEGWLEQEIKSAGVLIRKMGKNIQGIMLNSDLGTQSGPWIDPELYKELCAPYLKRFCDFIHRNSDYKLILHTCGSIKPLIQTLIECGIDAINPVQISANNMDPAELKHDFGDKITFWGGGCDTQRILNNGTPEDVRDNVKMLMRIFKKNSGFVFNQVHNIMGDISPENIISMFDTAYEESFY